MTPLFDYIKCPLHRYTFSVKPIREWVEHNCEGKTLNLFAGTTKLNIDEIRNDLDMEAMADYRMDAVEFLRTWTGEKFDTILLDPPYCYDKDTEILTDGGWVYFKDLHGTEKFATLNEQTNTVEYQNSTDFYTSQYEGEMIKIKSNSVDLLVTPNHNLYVRKLWRSNKFKLVEAKDMNYGCEFKSEFNWIGVESDTFILPEVNFDRHNRYGDMMARQKEINMDDWLRFLGIYLSEGCTDFKGVGYRTRIAQIKKDNRIIIKGWLEKIGFKFIIDKNGFTIYNKQLCLYLRQFGKTINKHIPNEIKQLSKRQLNILLDALILGDGHRSIKQRYNVKYNKYYSESHLSYHTISPKLKDDVYEIGLKSGYVCSSSRISLTNRINIQHTIRFSKYRNTPMLRKKKLNQYITTVQYNDIIYCITVPNHIVYVRRNGHSVWCGNSYRKSMEMYKGIRCSPFRQLKDEIMNVLKEGGKVITFGYHSNTLGAGRGFDVEKICLFSHGGAIHDTIASVERHIIKI